MRQSPRIRRLGSDHKAMQQLLAQSTIVHYSLPGPAFGDAPEAYLVTFRGRGLCRAEGCQEVRLRSEHQVLIRLGSSYPRMIPELLWKTPIFHPNISSNGIVCLGGYSTHWVPSLRLDQLCEMLWDMIRYRNFDVESPYNREAAQWARTQTVYEVPVDQRVLRDKTVGDKPGAAIGGPHKDSRFAYPAETEHLERPRAAAAPQPEILFMEPRGQIVQAELVHRPPAPAANPDILFID